MDRGTVTTTLSTAGDSESWPPSRTVVSIAEDFRAEVAEALERVFARRLDSGLRVDFRVPRALLMTEFDQWVFTTPGGVERRLGELCPVVVRSVDGRDVRSSFGEYVRRRSSLVVQRVDDPIDIERLVEGGPAGVVVAGDIGGDGRGRRAVDEIIARGVPVVLWCRGARAGKLFESALRRLAELPVWELPEAVMRLRREAAVASGVGGDEHVGRHLALYWDDPVPQIPSVRLCVAFEVVGGEERTSGLNEWLQEILIEAYNRGNVRGNAYFEEGGPLGSQLFVLPPIDVDGFLAGVVPRMLYELGEVNRGLRRTRRGRTRVRMVLTRGLIQHVGSGHVGDAVEALSWLKEALQVRETLDRLEDDFVVAVPDDLHRELPSDGFGVSGFERVGAAGAGRAFLGHVWARGWMSAD
ncbi:hypothetical protein ACFQ9X_28280 [Catenulispora yoronensis]